MQILAAIHTPVVTRAILECLEPPSRAPPIAPVPTEPGPLESVLRDW